MLMPRELQSRGGDVQLPRWIRRLLRRPIDPGPSAERIHEARSRALRGVRANRNSRKYQSRRTLIVRSSAASQRAIRATARGAAAARWTRGRPGPFGLQLAAPERRGLSRSFAREEAVPRPAASRLHCYYFSVVALSPSAGVGVRPPAGTAWGRRWGEGQ